MKDAGYDQKAEAMIAQMKERVNLAIATAVDERHSLEEGEAILREVLDALMFYNSADIAAEQMVNFSKVALFRGGYRMALSMAREAVETAASEQARAKSADNLHGLAYSLLERSLRLPQEDPEAQVVRELEQVLTPEDYCGALRRTAAAVSAAGSGEERSRMAEFVRSLSLEVLRQGLRQ